MLSVWICSIGLITLFFCSNKSIKNVHSDTLLIGALYHVECHTSGYTEYIVNRIQRNQLHLRQDDVTSLSLQDHHLNPSSTQTFHPATRMTDFSATDSAEEEMPHAKMESGFQAFLIRPPVLLTSFPPDRPWKHLAEPCHIPEPRRLHFIDL